MIRRAQRFESMIFLIINFSTFGSNMFLTLKIMDFENVVLIKSCSYSYDKKHECITYMI
jgi:hypothetical protein